MADKHGFIPAWREQPAPEGSFRSIFKYGAPERFKHPSPHWYEMFKDEFGMSDSDFKKPINEGLEPVKLDRPISLDAAHINKLKELVGADNVATDGYSRVRHSTGQTLEETFDLREGKISEVVDAVVHPRDKEDVAKIVEYCALHKIPIYPSSARSGCVFGIKPLKAGISLAIATHMNKLLAVSEINQMALVQPGMMGPAYEKALNRAPELFGTKRAYTCGHFPQSFEYSSVGGWVLALGSGQASTYYGDAGDLVSSMEFVTPRGRFVTRDFPATATGPKVNDMMKGSEGAFGVLVEMKMKIFRHQPQNRTRFDFMFPNWESAVNTAREVIQGEFGKPAVFRISDPEETDRGLKLFGFTGNVSKIFAALGYKPMQRCLLMGNVEGDADYTHLVKRKIRAVCRHHGALYLGGIGSKKWELTRYTEPFMREDLNDYGILIDTLESGVTWENLHRLHQGVRGFIKARPRTMCMTHASHFYPQGTNLYFIFILRGSLAEFAEFKKGIIEKINEHGGSLSHHHGSGRQFGPFMEKHLGREQINVLRALKRHFDPDNIMNPGGSVLGLD